MPEAFIKTGRGEVLSRLRRQGYGAWFPRVAWQADPMSECIAISPDVCNGKPVVHGTGITVQTVLEFLAAGDSVEDVLAEYPTLKREDVQACLDYASRVIGNHFSVLPVA